MQQKIFGARTRFHGRLISWTSTWIVLHRSSYAWTSTTFHGETSLRKSVFQSQVLVKAPLDKHPVAGGIQRIQTVRSGRTFSSHRSSNNINGSDNKRAAGERSEQIANNCGIKTVNGRHSGRDMSHPVTYVGPW